MDETAMSASRDAASRRAFLASGARIVAASGLARLPRSARRAGRPRSDPADHVLRAARFRAAPDGRSARGLGLQRPASRAAPPRQGGGHASASGSSTGCPCRRRSTGTDSTSSGPRRWTASRGSRAADPAGRVVRLRVRRRAGRDPLVSLARRRPVRQRAVRAVRRGGGVRRSRPTTGTRCSSSTTGSASRATPCSPASLKSAPMGRHARREGGDVEGRHAGHEEGGRKGRHARDGDAHEGRRRRRRSSRGSSTARACAPGTKGPLTTLEVGDGRDDPAPAHQRVVDLHLPIPDRRPPPDGDRQRRLAGEAGGRSTTSSRARASATTCCSRREARGVHWIRAATLDGNEVRAVLRYRGEGRAEPSRRPSAGARAP